MDFKTHLEEQIKFSEKTFGPGDRLHGCLNHIRKELDEIEKNPNDLEEWIDVILLACDGAWRQGYSPDEIVNMLQYKFNKNKNREWPDWRNFTQDTAIEHIKE